MVISLHDDRKALQKPVVLTNQPDTKTKTNLLGNAQWEESFFPKTSVAIVILFWLKWAGYLLWQA